MKLKQLLTLHFTVLDNERMTLLEIRNINSRILEQNDTIITKDLLIGNTTLIILRILLFQKQQLTILFLQKGLMVPFLFKSQT